MKRIGNVPLIVEIGDGAEFLRADQPRERYRDRKLQSLPQEDIDATPDDSRHRARFHAMGLQCAKRAHASLDSIGFRFEVMSMLCTLELHRCVRLKGSRMADDGEVRKFGKLDAAFVARRNEFFLKNAELDPKFILDQWPLFVGFVPLGTLIARYELLKMVQGIPGHLLEFGSYYGSHLLFIAKVMQLLAPNDLRKVYGFESLEGLTEFSKNDRHAKAERGNLRGDLRMMKKMLALHDIEDRVQMVVGDIEKTLPRFLKKNAHHIYSYVYLDTDLYRATATALRLCWPRLAPGGIVAFDEGYHDRYPGEGAACQEFLKTIPSQFECGHFPVTRQPMIWIRKK